MTHTRTPWGLDQNATGTQWMITVDGYDDEGSHHRGVISTLAITNEHSEANAAFIVRACNAHDDLVVALKSIIENTRKYSDQWEIAKSAIDALASRGGIK